MYPAAARVSNEQEWLIESAIGKKYLREIHSYQSYAKFALPVDVGSGSEDHPRPHGGCLKDGSWVQSGCRYCSSCLGSSSSNGHPWPSDRNTAEDPDGEVLFVCSGDVTKLFCLLEEFFVYDEATCPPKYFDASTFALPSVPISIEVL